MNLAARSPSLERGLERVRGVLVLAPALFLSWFGPKAPLEGDPHPELSGAAIAAIASLVSLVLMIARRAMPRASWAWAYVAFVAVGAISLVLEPPADTLEADRARILAAVSLVTLAAAASLGSPGIDGLVKTLACLAPYALVPAFADGENGFAGALGNTGSTSEVALLGAAAGAWLAANGERAWRWIGALAAAAYAFYVGLAPVLAGAAAFALVLALGLALGRDSRRVWALTGIVAVAAFGAGRLVPHRATPPAPAAVEARPAGDIGGLEIRRRIWARVPALVLDYGPLGAGPGQFGAAFPPYRDPAEIELSSHQRSLPRAETEVEHAHSDYLQGFVDGGWIGGAAWLAFLAAVAWRAVRALRERGEKAALALAALATLANAFFREPLLWNPASASAAFACFGVLVASDPHGRFRRALGLVALAGMALVFREAWEIAAHGRALAVYVQTGNREHARFALQMREDSWIARSIAARELEKQAAGEGSREVVDAWRGVLALRPSRVEALIQLGLAHARLHEPDEARLAWSRALALDPGHPALPVNLARLEALEGDLDRAIQALESSGRDVPASLRELATVAFRELRPERGWELLARADERFAELGPEKAYALARAEDLALSDEERLALEGSAHLAWARQHGASGDLADAARSYRQAKRCLARTDAAGAPRWPALLHLELAGALAASGKTDEARSELAGVDAAGRDLIALPAWAGQALLQADLLRDDRR